MKGIRFATLLALTLGVCLAFPAQAQKAKAKKLFDKGVAAMEDLDYKAALEAFEGAYEASPHWMVLAHIGNCHAKLNNPVKAIEAMEQYLDEGGEDIAADERDSARKILAGQRKKVGVLFLLVKPKGAEARIDGESYGEAPFEEILLKAGPHHIMVIREGGDVEEKDIDIEAGEEHTVRMYPKDDSVAAVITSPPPEEEEEEEEEEEPEEEEPEEEGEPEEEAEPEPAAPPADGVLAVNANVEDASVSVDGEDSGSVPFEEVMAAGKYELEVAAEGYLSFSDSVAVEGDMLNTVDVTLASDDDKPDPLNVPFFVSVGVAGAGLITMGVGWGLYGYYNSSEGNYADRLADPTFSGYNYNRDCSGSTVDNEVELYFCENEWQRREYADKRGKMLGVGVAGTVVTVLGLGGAALFYFYPEIIFGAESDATFTLTPLATNDEAGLVLGGTF